MSASNFKVPASYGATLVRKLDGTIAPTSSGALVPIGEVPVLIE